MLRILQESHRAYWVLVAMVLLAGVALSIWLVRLRSPFNEAVYERIHLGMTLEEVTMIVDKPPGYYNVSPEENFLIIRHEGVIIFGEKNSWEVDPKSAVYDIVSEETGKPVAVFRKWVSGEDGIFVVTQEDKVIGKVYVASFTFYNRDYYRKRWLTRLGQRVGL